MTQKTTTTVKTHNVEGVLVPMTDGVTTEPNLLFKGEKPNEGDVIIAIVENGSTYKGTVKSAVMADGEVVCDFVDGLTFIK